MILPDLYTGILGSTDLDRARHDVLSIRPSLPEHATPGDRAARSRSQCTRAVLLLALRSRKTLDSAASQLRAVNFRSDGVLEAPRDDMRFLAIVTNWGLTFELT
jgi:hypothetical protein